MTTGSLVEVVPVPVHLCRFILVCVWACLSYCDLHGCVFVCTRVWRLVEWTLMERLKKRWWAYFEPHPWVVLWTCWWFAQRTPCCLEKWSVSIHHLTIKHGFTTAVHDCIWHKKQITNWGESMGPHCLQCQLVFVLISDSFNCVSVSVNHWKYTTLGITYYSVALQLQLENTSLQMSSSDITKAMPLCSKFRTLYVQLRHSQCPNLKSIIKC